MKESKPKKSVLKLIADSNSFYNDAKIKAANETQILKCLEISLVKLERAYDM